MTTARRTPVIALWQALSFRAKLVCSGVLLQTAMLVAVGLGATTLVDRYLEHELQARVGQIKPLFNAALAAPLAQRDYATVAAILAETRVTRDLVFLRVRDSEGRVIAEDRAAVGATAPGATGQKSMAIDAESTFDFQAPLEMGGQGLGRIEFGLSRQALADTRQSLLWALAAMGTLALLVFSALLAALSHALTRPLAALVVAARDIHAANYDVEFDPQRKDELGVLMKAFSRMGLEVRRKVTELMNSEVLQRKYLQEAMRRQTETNLALQAAETANAAKADFIANMSHEIRTPMNAIVGYADMLLRTPLNADQHDYAGRLQTASSTLLGVVNQVLDFSRIEAGQVKASAEPFDLVAMVDNVVGLFQPQLRDRAVRLRLEIDPDVPGHICGDALRLHQVLVNLVGNAVKFTEEGEVLVRVQCQVAESARPVLRLRVSDTGIGIDASQIERIFSPFAQADGSITRRFGGTGLGLSISRQLTELMGGTLSVRSAPGRGSEFTVEVPFDPVTQSTAEARAAGLQGLPSARGAPSTPNQTLQGAPPSPPSQPAPAARVADTTAIAPWLDELDDLLSRNMMGARRVAARLRDELQGTDWAGPFADIEQDVRRLRFREARGGLAALRARQVEASSGSESASPP